MSGSLAEPIAHLHQRVTHMKDNKNHMAFFGASEDAMAALDLLIGNTQAAIQVLRSVNDAEVAQ